MKLFQIFEDLTTEFKTFALAKPSVAQPPPPTVRHKFSRSGPPAFMLVIDTSPSMLASDYPPTRLGAAKAAAVAFVEQCRQNRLNSQVGIVFFSSTAVLGLGVLPASEVHRRIRGVLNLARIDGGTDISAGLTRARDELVKLGNKLAPTIILLTDGEANAGANPVQTAAWLKAEGVQLDIIGIGGSPSEVNEVDLKRMASVVDGQLHYWFIRDTPALVRKFEALALAEV